MKRWCLAAWLLLICLLLSGCMETKAPVQEDHTGEHLSVEKAPAASLASAGLSDKASLYTEYDPTSVVCFYVTVTGGNAADGTNHTFEEVNSYQNLQGMTGVEKIKTEIILQIGDEKGPLWGEVGYSALGSNATMNVRGKTSTLAPQKSYRINLFDSAGLWRGQRAIALNKHPYDNTRFRNMLYFELLQDVPGLTSMRTQFVHLYVKDLTADIPDTAFHDFGLYTQVELPNSRFLRNHEFNREGDLYKANVFEFYRYADALVLANDPAYNEENFELVIESKNSNDHSKLLDMLDKVNDYSVPIQDTVEKYFNLDNLTSFLAYNILINNIDTKSQNFLLYSPVNSQTWYFICWDGDGALKKNEEYAKDSTQVEAFYYHQGISNYWGVVLFNRMMRVQEYREALIDKVEALRAIVTPEKTKALIEKYDQVVLPYLQSMPDAMYLETSLEKRASIIEDMPAEIDECYRIFMESLEKPMPFYMGEPQLEDGKLHFNWDPAYDFDGEFIRYDLRIGTDWALQGEGLIYESLGQLEQHASLDMLPPGIYYWQVTACNESGYIQMPFDQLVTDSGTHIGLKRFQITEQGEVILLP